MAINPNTDALLATKKAAREGERKRNLPIAEAIDEATGKVKIWHIEDAKWIVVHPVDAAEQIARGIAVMAPDVPMELETEFDGLEDMNVPELRAIAAARGIELGGMRKKTDIIAAIQDSVDPEDESTDLDLEDQE